MPRSFPALVRAVLILGVLAPLFITAAPQPGVLRHAEITYRPDGSDPLYVRFASQHAPEPTEFLADYSRAFAPSGSVFAETARYRDGLGMEHVRYRQLHNGVVVDGGELILHQRDGRVLLANGRTYSGLTAGMETAISEAEALTIALQRIGAERYMWENPEQVAHLRMEQNDPAATYYPTGEPILTAPAAAMSADQYRLCYRFDIYAEQPVGKYIVDVDARTGEVIRMLDQLCGADEAGSGEAMYNGTVNLTVDNTGSGYRLRSTGRGVAILTQDMQNGTNYGAAVDFTDPDNYFDEAEDAAGVQAHWALEASYDYYLAAHNRNSYNNAGAPLHAYVHYSSGYNNAFWDGVRMTFGDGDGTVFSPLVPLDVVAHELTHGVTQYSAGLIYERESGALNESFSDVFGVAVEFFAEGPAGDWLIGEDCSVSRFALRSMSNPNSLGDPDTYFGAGWASLDGGDNGGVHTNSGVQNFWYYLLSEGGSGVNDHGFAYSVTGIGLEAATAIAYRNLAVYLTRRSGYFDARVGAWLAAIDLYGAGSVEADAVIDAWNAVGVDRPTFEPTAALSADSLFFVAENQIGSDTLQLTVTNISLDTLEVTGVQVSGSEYQLLNLPTFPLTLSDFEQGFTIDIAYQPTRAGIHYETVTVLSNDVTTPQREMVLSGKGYVIHPPAEAVIYAVTGSVADGSVLTLDAQSGNATFLGSTGFYELLGLAVDPVTDELVGTFSSASSSTSLLRIDAASGEAYEGMVIPEGLLRAIAIDGTGDMYAAKFNNGMLFRIDRQTGAPTQVGATGICLLSGLAIHPQTGEMFAASVANKLYRIDKATGQSTLVGEPGISQMAGIAFDAGGTLFALSGYNNTPSDLYVLNTATGAASLVGGTGYDGILALTMRGTVLTGIAEDGEAATARPTAFALRGNYPNPFNPTTTIRYDLARQARVTLTVYNALGQAVRTLVSSRQNAGVHQVNWDGRNDRGEPVSSGVYLYRMAVTGEGFARQFSAKMLMMK